MPNKSHRRRPTQTSSRNRYSPCPLWTKSRQERGAGVLHLRKTFTAALPVTRFSLSVSATASIWLTSAISACVGTKEDMVILPCQDLWCRGVSLLGDGKKERRCARPCVSAALASGVASRFALGNGFSPCNLVLSQESQDCLWTTVDDVENFVLRFSDDFSPHPESVRSPEME